jgi:hypothetical protein
MISSSLAGFGAKEKRQNAISPLKNPKWKE